MQKPIQPNKKHNSYLKYSGLGFQLAALVLLSIYLGKWIDAKLGFEKPISVLILILFFFSLFMYKLYLELIKNK
jgi:hypothetical protein